MFELVVMFDIFIITIDNIL